MELIMSTYSLLVLVPLLASAQDPPVAISSHLTQDTALTLDVNSELWKGAPAVLTDHGPKGEIVPGKKTEVRSRWSDTNIYFLFICPYQELHLIDSPSTTTETNKLWDHDVAEVFIGGDFEKFWQYREFQVSPQGEWVDLDIDTRQPKPEGGWRWNSGYSVAARLDRQNKIWYGAMKIPFAAIDARTPAPGNQYRVNFYRLQGPPPNRVQIAWNPTNSNSYHVPEAFGRLRLDQ
jgi:hypothetical protein